MPDFGREVIPILSDHCFHCHGPDPSTRQADLRLDHREHAQGVLGGTISDSEVWARIVASEDDVRMPPPDQVHQLDAHERDVLRRWIDGGSPYQSHWAFETPQRAVPPPPDPQNLTGAAKGPVDAFLNEALAEAGLSPVGSTDPQTYARRVALTLTGLPAPEPWIQDYLRDPSPKNKTILIDRLLASPDYGIHHAKDWLDAVRYGDTHGMARDDERSIWLYRDWVVDALNASVPFDRFTIAQLAGDLLQDPSVQDHVATGFLRCNVSTAEGGSIEDELVVSYAADRVDTIGTVWMGLTVACAKCHDHKFDPLSQKEYYQLLALVNNLDEEPMNGNAMAPPPLVRVPDEDQAKELADIEEQIVHLERRRDLLARQRVGEADFAADLAHLLRDDGQPEWSWHRLSGLRVPNNTAIAEDWPLGPEKPFDDSDTFDRVVRSGPWDDLSQPKPDRPTVRWEAFDASSERVSVSGDNEAKFFHATLRADRPTVLRLEFGSDETLWKPVRYQIWLDERLVVAHRYRQDEVPFDDALDLAIGPGVHSLKIAVSAFGGPLRGWFRMHAPEEPLTKTKAAELLVCTMDPHGRELTENLRQLQDRRLRIEQSVAVSMVARERTAARPTFVLDRGRYDHPTVAVHRATPRVLGGRPTTDRLDFARWLVSPRHPLTARVAINRIWGQAFGRPLVETSGDFGLQGTRPTHPKMLDDLAARWPSRGWDIKRLRRELLSTAAFARRGLRPPSSDPSNRWLSVAAVHRLDSETIRDTRMLAAGMLDRRMGGRGVKPPQPTGLWAPVSQPNSTTANFVADSGTKPFRRSLYLFWKRTAPPPSMQTFDAPTRDACLVARSRTNTPLQALALLNDFQNMQAAGGMAIRRGGGNLDIPQAFEDAVGRRPTDAESARLRSLHRDLRDHYAEHTQDAERLVRSLELQPWFGGPVFPPNEVAAATMLCNTLLNLSESITRP